MPCVAPPNDAGHLMTWTRLDDGWTDRRDIRALPLPARWYYLSLIQWCSRTQCYDGVMEEIDALRCSDLPDTESLLRTVCAQGFAVRDDGTVRLPRIGEHVPPPWMRDEDRKAKQAEKKRRSRLHLAGDHSICLPDSCAHAVTRDVTGDTGTGQDGTGQDGTGREVPTPRRGGDETSHADERWGRGYDD